MEMATQPVPIKIRIKAFMLEGSNSKRIAIAGNEEEYKRILSLLKESSIKTAFAGFISTEVTGNISEQNNVEVANKNISEIVAYVPEQSGQTPLVLFRTFADKNFRPGISFPFLPAQ
jgi:hypothetical protein